MNDNSNKTVSGMRVLSDGLINVGTHNKGGITIIDVGPTYKSLLPLDVDQDKLSMVELNLFNTTLD